MSLACSVTQPHTDSSNTLKIYISYLSLSRFYLFFYIQINRYMSSSVNKRRISIENIMHATVTTTTTTTKCMPNTKFIDQRIFPRATSSSFDDDEVKITLNSNHESNKWKRLNVCLSDADLPQRISFNKKKR